MYKRKWCDFCGNEILLIRVDEIINDFIWIPSTIYSEVLGGTANAMRYYHEHPEDETLERAVRDALRGTKP